MLHDATWILRLPPLCRAKVVGDAPIPPCTPCFLADAVFFSDCAGIPNFQSGYIDNIRQDKIYIYMVEYIINMISMRYNVCKFSIHRKEQYELYVYK